MNEGSSALPGLMKIVCEVADMQLDTRSLPVVNLFLEASHLFRQCIHSHIVELRFQAVQRCRKSFPILRFAEGRKCGYLAGYLRFEDGHEAVDQLLVAAHQVMEQGKIHDYAAPGLKMSL